MNSLDQRKFTIITAFIIIGFIFLFRLFQIQVLDKSYLTSADNQALRFVTKYPSRGIVYDRNGEILVLNQAAYDLMIVPSQVTDLDTQNLCQLLEINMDEFITNFDKAKSYSRYRASIFKKQMTASEFAILAERLYQFPGFYGQKT